VIFQRVQQQLTWFWHCFGMSVQINKLGFDGEVIDAKKVAHLLISRWKCFEGH
jgi:hypothetical protein